MRLIMRYVIDNEISDRREHLATKYKKKYKILFYNECRVVNIQKMPKPVKEI